MTAALFIATALAGFAYVIAPGPAFLAVFALAAADGRRAALRFLQGHLVGDVLWSALAIAALVGANRLGPTLFDLLGLACGAYLLYLGFRAVLTRKLAEAEPIGRHRPALTGVLFGLTNPKSYPVATAMFAGIALPFAHELSWIDAPSLLVAAFAGFIPGYGLIVLAAGLPTVRRFFARNGIIVTRIVGTLFVAFGARALWEAGRSLGLQR